MFCWLKDQSYNIILLQETHSTHDIIDNWTAEWGKNAYFSGTKSNSQGVCILINDEFSCDILNYFDIIKGRLQALELKINDTIITVLNIYGPNKDEVSLFEKLEEFVLLNDDKSLIIGGDFNTFLDVDKDRKNGLKDCHKNIRKKLNTIINTNSLTDIWRVQHPNTNKYTWHSNTKPIIFSRLDYFLISNNLVNFVSKTEIKSGYNTDHSIITLNVNFVKIDKGPGVFKINNSILLQNEYQKIIKNSIKNIVDINKDCNPNTLWELIKGSCRNETIKYTTFKKKKDLEKETALKSEIEQLETQIINTNQINNINQIKNELDNKKHELNDLIDKKINGILLRSKANLIEHNEKNSKYFSNLEKKRAESKIITKLTINGTVTANQKLIRNEQKKFYESLYSKTETSESTINFFDNHVNKLNDIEQSTCEGILSEYECGIALKQMNNCKSPGSDGITTEFYKIFWQDIKTFFVNSINYSFEKHSLTDLQKQGLITLLPKTDKDLSIEINCK